MSPRQVQVLEQVDQLMSEHFDAYQMSAQILDIDGATPGDGYTHQYHGPLSCVMGLLDMHKITLTKLYASDESE